MDLSASPVRLPLDTDTNGTVRIGNTRITLDTVISAFKNGSTSEEIVFQFPVLDLGDVYAVIGFYLKNQEVVEQYLAKQDDESVRIRQYVLEKFPGVGIRRRLLERRNLQKPTAL